MQCPRCDGTGEMECPLEYGGPHPENCPACGGDNVVECERCEGTGEIPDEED